MARAEKADRITRVPQKLKQAKGGLMTMHEFLIFYAPLLIVALSIAAVFIWGAKADVSDS